MPSPCPCGAAADYVRSVEAEVQAFTRGGLATDDRTLVVVRVA